MDGEEPTYPNGDNKDRYGQGFHVVGHVLISAIGGSRFVDAHLEGRDEAAEYNARLRAADQSTAFPRPAPGGDDDLGGMVPERLRYVGD